MHITPSFLLIADNTINLSLEESLKSKLKSHLIYSLLFEDHIILSDNQIIDNRNFRLLIRDNDPLINALNKDNFSVAFRNYIDVLTGKGLDRKIVQEPGIKDILRGFISWDKFRWTSNSKSDLEYQKEKKSYESYEDLEYISQKGNIERYKIEDVALTYSNHVLDLLESDITKRLIGEQAALTVLQLAKQKRNEFKKAYSDPNASFGFTFFEKDLPNKLAELEQSEMWEKHSSEILQIAHSPYITALPKVLNCNPIYGQMHKEKIEIARGKDSILQQIEDDYFYETNINLLNFELAISRLSADSILKLRDSSEFKEYRKYINKFSDSENSIDDIRDTLIEYKHRIDDEIILEFPHLKNPQKEKRENIKLLNIVDRSASYAGVLLDGLAVMSMPFPGIDVLGLGAGIISLFTSNSLGKKTAKKIDRERRLKEEHKQKSINYIKNMDDSIIKSERSMAEKSNFNQEIFFKSV